MPTITRRQLLAGVAASQLAQGQRITPPNIIFIMADDLGYADLSCYGRRDYTTPHLDGLAAGGTRLLQAYANSPVCSSTRTALITGRYQYRLRVGLEEPHATGGANVGLPAGQPTLPGLLRTAGYNTALIGKWHLGRLPEYSPLQSGYDHFWGFRNGYVDYFTHKNAAADTNTDDLWDGDQPVHQTGYLTDLLGNHAVSFLEANRQAPRPFFLSLHFNAPHWPWEGPGDEAESKRIRNLRHYDGGSQAIYAAMVRQMDLQVGRVLKTLEKNGRRAIPSWFSPVTTAASALPIPGRSPARRQNCWRAAFGFPPSSAGQARCRRAKHRNRWPSAWTGCQPFWNWRARRATPPTLLME